MAEFKNVYQLGHFRFTLKGENSGNLNYLKSLFADLQANSENCAGPSKAPPFVFDVDNPYLYIENPNPTVKLIEPAIWSSIISYKALLFHENYIWLDAATLVTPQGKVILLCGKSNTGKSTTCAVLELVHQFRILADDLSLLSTSVKQVLPFGLPISLKEGTSRILEAEYPQMAFHLFDDQWLIASSALQISDKKENPRAAYLSKLDRIDMVILLDSAEEPSKGTGNLSLSDGLRRLAGLSNVLRLPNGLETLEKYVNESAFFTLEFLPLKSRINKLVELLSQEYSFSKNYE